MKYKTLTYFSSGGDAGSLAGRVVSCDDLLYFQPLSVRSEDLFLLVELLVGAGRHVECRRGHSSTHLYTRE